MSASRASPATFDIVELDEVDSTNSEAIRRAGDFSRPTWILAHRQTAGRGRRGRPWVDPAGNFAATLMLRPEAGPLDAAQRSFVAALALRSTLALHVEASAIGLKWPNDVLLNGGKLAGILLEAGGRGDRIDWLAVGIGVNLRAAPDTAGVEDGALRPVSLLGETGVSIAPRAFLDQLAPRYAAHEAVLAREGFAEIRRLWLAHAARLGQPVTARTGAETIVGQFRGIDDSGALLVRTENGTVAIPAAEVFF